MTPNISNCQAPPSWHLPLLDYSLLGLAGVLPICIAGTNLALGLASAALLLGVVCGVERPAWHRAWIPAVWCVGLYCAVSILTSLTAISPVISLHDMRKDLHKLWVIVLLLLALPSARTRRISQALAVSFAFIASYGIAQSCLGSWQSHLNGGASWVWTRAHGFIHPVTYGEIMALGLLGCICFFARPENPAQRRAPVVALGILLAAACVMSHTRGALVGLFAGAVALCVADPKFRRWIKWGLLAALVAAAAMEFLPTHRSLLASVKTFGTNPADNPQLIRLVLWKVAWRMFQDHPWLGVGPSNYNTAYAYYYQGSLAGQRIWGEAHNLYLNQLAERGLLGLAALAAVLGSIAARAWRRARRNPNAWNLWAWGAVVAFLVMNLTEDAFQVELMTTFFLFIWAWSEANAEVPAAKDT